MSLLSLSRTPLVSWCFMLIPWALEYLIFGKYCQFCSIYMQFSFIKCDCITSVQSCVPNIFNPIRDVPNICNLVSQIYGLLFTDIGDVWNLLILGDRYVKYHNSIWCHKYTMWPSIINICDSESQTYVISQLCNPLEDWHPGSILKHMYSQYWRYFIIEYCNVWCAIHGSSDIRTCLPYQTLLGLHSNSEKTTGYNIWGPVTNPYPIHMLEFPFWLAHDQVQSVHSSHALVRDQL